MNLSISNNTLYSQLQNIKFSTFLFNIRPKEEIILNKFVGTTIRGGFGYSFKKVVCLFKEKTNCGDCVLSRDCAYSLIFESKLQKEQSSLKTSEIPRPYIFDTSTTYKQRYTKEEIFSLKLTLIGKAIQYLPYFFLSIQKLGESGFGYRRKNFTINEVIQKYPVEKRIYSIETQILTRPDTGFLHLDQSSEQNKEIDELTIKFLTPARIKYNGSFISILEFHQFIRSLVHRLTFLAEHWCDTYIEYDWKNLIASAEKIKIKKCDTIWLDLERYSSRQKTKMKMGGIVGEITYKGNIELFLPLIYLGSHLHTGKNTTFGLGQYHIV